MFNQLTGRLCIVLWIIATVAHVGFCAWDLSHRPTHRERRKIFVSLATGAAPLAAMTYYLAIHGWNGPLHVMARYPDGPNHDLWSIWCAVYLLFILACPLAAFINIALRFLPSDPLNTQPYQSRRKEPRDISFEIPLCGIVAALAATALILDAAPG